MGTLRSQPPDWALSWRPWPTLYLETPPLASSNSSRSHQYLLYIMVFFYQEVCLLIIQACAHYELRVSMPTFFMHKIFYKTICHKASPFLLIPIIYTSFFKTLTVVGAGESQTSGTRLCQST